MEKVLNAIRKMCKGKTQTAVARELGISSSYLSDILNGKREVSEGLAKRVGFKRVIKYERI